MRDDAEKPTKSGDDPSVGSMHEEMVTESPVVKRTLRQPKKAPKSPEFVETESHNSDDEGRMVKRIQTLPKKAQQSPKPDNTDPDNSDDEAVKSCGDSS